MSSTSDWQLALPKHGERRCAIAALLAALVATMLLVLAAACPGVALAGTTDMGSAHVVDGDGKTIYDGDKVGPSECLNWVQGEGKDKGGVIVMDSDWTFGRQQEIQSSCSVTIKTMGHKISRNGSEVGEGCLFWLCENSTLTLDGSDKPNTDFSSVQVYTGESYTSTARMNFTSGGLLTGGHSNNSGGAVEMKAGSTLKLVNVTIAGNKANTANGGAVRMDGANCTLSMMNSAIEYNVSEVDNAHTAGGEGGALYIGGENANVTLNNSSISHNAAQIGGGIYANNANATINMTNHSKMDYNRAIGSGTGDNSGGAIHFDSSDFTLVGNTADGDVQSISYNECVNAKGGAIRTANHSTGEIKGITFEHNHASDDQGGAIWVNSGQTTISQCTFNKNYAKADGGAIYGNAQEMKVIDCTFTGNTTDANGGALYMDSASCLVQRCTFTGNEAEGSDSEGGAIYNTASGNKLDACTITGNFATKDGGGVFESCNYNLEVSGVLRVYNNTRRGPSADDVFVNSNDVSGGGSVDGHLVGNVSKGSWIGLRTSSDGSYKVVKDLTNYIEGSYFMDLPDSFALEYDSSSHILSQVAKTNAKYKVTVNGRGEYQGSTGETYEVDATASKYADGKAFWCWDAENTTGLQGTTSLEELTGGDLTKSTISITIPNNDVHLVAKYVPYLTSATVALDVPVPGESLPKKATLAYEDANKSLQSVELDIVWLQESDGKYVQATSSTALYNTAYVAQIDIAPDYEKGLAPAKLSASQIQVYMGSYESQAASDAMWDESGKLTLTTEAYTTPCKKVASVGDIEALTVYAGTSAADLAKQLPTTVTATTEDGSSVTLKLEDATSADFDWSQYGIFDENKQVKEPASDASADVYAITLKVLGGASETVDVPEKYAAVSVKVTVKHPKCTVAVDPDNGEDAIESTVEWGSYLEALDEPTYEGHDFLGWYEPGSDVEFDFASPITGDVELVAKWQAKTYKVYFQSPGATPSGQYADVEWGTQADEPTEPTMEHYEFSGWYAADSETPYDFSQAVTSSFTLYAGWTPCVYTVTFDPATGEQVMEVPTEYNTALEQPQVPSRPGYKFLGWYASDGAEWDFTAPVACDMTLTARWDTVAPTTFVDLTEDWCVDWVTTAAERGLMNGYTDSMGNYTGYFGPSDTLTRGQVATVLWRVAGCPNPARTDYFDAGDVDPGTYYAKAVNWCYEKGVITGYKAGPNAGRFLPGNGVTREELATMVYRFAQWAGIETSDVPTANFDRCVDSALVSDWARDASVWCAAANVVNGKEVTEGDAMFYRLDPQWGATRAQAAKVFVTLDNLYGGQAPYEPAQPGDDTSGDGDVSGQAEASFEEVATFDAVEQAETVEQPEAVEEAPVAAETVEQPEAVEEAPVAAEAADEQADAGFEDVEFDEAA